MGSPDATHGDGLRRLTMNPSAETRFYSADEFWDILQKHGMELTDSYTADGRSRFGKRRNGDWCVLSVHDQYPEYVVDRVLIECGYLPPPEYEHLN